MRQFSTKETSISSKDVYGTPTSGYNTGGYNTLGDYRS